MTSKFWCKRNQGSNRFNSWNKIGNLGKTSGANMAMEGISLNIFQDQITVLLGVNGAGKTTTISKLKRKFPPTNVNAEINGYDFRTQNMSVRNIIVLCPQHVTCQDHVSII
ncbi:hypothetical protein HHI36_018150 [Cryptolaemus montrouzieri]|uniref:ABC transporter domain-containing protein n=1 Tax=Cryptolaemus montrouzieri TaxID=559131 RepID=A0ABD2NZ65_9CUCU